jgi:hypothetical protein
MNNFDLTKFLVENKLTTATRLADKQKEASLIEGIHDRDITSAPHTNIKTPPEAIPYDPSKRAASLARLRDFGPKKEEKGFEDYEESENELILEPDAEDLPGDVTRTHGETPVAEDFSKYSSVEELMKEIENSTNEAAHKHKMERVKAAYESLESKATSLEEGEHAEYMATGKIKEMKVSAKKLRKMYESLSKIYEKKYAKKEKKA